MSARPYSGPGQRQTVATRHIAPDTRTDEQQLADDDNAEAAWQRHVEREERLWDVGGLGMPLTGGGGLTTLAAVVNDLTDRKAA